MIKRVNPELLPALEAFQEPDFQPESMQAIRDAMAEMSIPAEIDESISVSDEIIQGPDDNSLRLRIYRPKLGNEKLPVLYWIHGGGYIIGTVEDDDALCMRFVTEANCVVVSVDYRLAPETPYPGPIEDCYTGLKWIADSAEHLNIDPDRIGIAGASAGGGLTAGLTLLARDRDYPKVSFQAPLYPMIDDGNNTPSTNEITEGMIWNQNTNEAGWKMYLGDLYGTEDIPAYAAPARADDYSNLPTTYTCVGQLDPFRSETLTYVEKLAEAGVDVEFHLYPGAYHGFDTLNPSVDLAMNAVDEYLQAVKKGFNR